MTSTVSGNLPAELTAAQRGDDAGGRIARNVRALAGGQIVTWTMTLLWTLVVPRALGPAGLGLVVSAMSVTGVVAIVLGLGTRNYLVREIVVNPIEAGRLLGTALVLRLGLAPLVVGAVVVYSALTHTGGEARTVLYLVALASLLTLLAEPLQAGFQAIERMKYLAYSDVINKTAQSLLGIAVVAVGFRAVGIAASMAAVAAIVIVLNALWLARFIRVEFRTTAALLMRMIRQSVAYWAFAVFSMLYLWIDTIMLSLMTRSEVVGWYGAPVRLFQTLMFLPVLLSTAWLPRLVAAFGQGEAELRRTARKPIELVLVLSAPIAAGTAMVASTFVPVLYGDAYRHAVPVMIILGLCLPPMYTNIMLSQVLIAANRQASWTWVMIVATIVNPVFNIVLIPLTEHRYGNGAIGAALSLLLTELVLVSCGFAIAGRGVLDRSTLRRTLLSALASIAMWAVAYAASPAGVAVAVTAGIATFVALALALGLPTDEERDVIRRRLGRTRRPSTV
jgi:O-antigen/teichoic acid export membrane protein